uniref:Uncharacterized protein n=1 Tax=Felis catus TaxID=9685 RepID=A0ABI7X6U9_FELCA
MVILELAQDDLSAPGGRQELRKKEWTLQSDAGGGAGPREFLALVTGRTKPSRSGGRQSPGGRGPQPPQQRSPAPRGARPGFSGPAGGERHVAAGAQGQRRSRKPVTAKRGGRRREGGQSRVCGHRGLCGPVGPWRGGEMLKVAWVMESLGWSDKRGQTEALPAVLPVPRRDTRGAREKVDEAGRRVDAVVLRKAAGAAGSAFPAWPSPSPSPRARGPGGADERRQGRRLGRREVRARGRRAGRGLGGGAGGRGERGVGARGRGVQEAGGQAGAATSGLGRSRGGGRGGGGGGRGRVGVGWGGADVAPEGKAVNREKKGRRGPCGGRRGQGSAAHPPPPRPPSRPVVRRVVAARGCPPVPLGEPGDARPHPPPIRQPPPPTPCDRGGLPASPWDPRSAEPPAAGLPGPSLSLLCRWRDDPQGRRREIRPLRKAAAPAVAPGLAVGTGHLLISSPAPSFGVWAPTVFTVGEGHAGRHVSRIRPVNAKVPRWALWLLQPPPTPIPSSVATAFMKHSHTCSGGHVAPSEVPAKATG